MGFRLYNMPLISLSHAHVMLLCERILTVNKRIDEVNHLYYKETILNSLFTFYLDLSDIIERSGSVRGGREPDSLRKYHQIFYRVVCLQL